MRGRRADGARPEGGPAAAIFAPVTVPASAPNATLDAAPRAPDAPPRRPPAPPGPAAPSAPGLPAITAGLRAGAAIVVPIALAWYTGQPALLVAALGGWLTSMADVGGAYRVRARMMGGYVVAGSLLVALGTLVGTHHALVVPLLFGAAAFGALLRVAGEPGAVLGTLGAVTLISALDAASLPGGGHGTVRGALLGATLFAAGGLWALLLALVVWPVRPWRPARRAVAVCHLRLAGWARALAAAVRRPDDEAAAALHGLASTWHPRVRTAIEEARATLVATRRTRTGASRRADDVVLALAHADDLFTALGAATEELDALVAAGAPADVRAAAARAVEALAATLEAVAAALPGGEQRAVRVPVATLEALDAAVVALWRAVEPSPLEQPDLGVPADARADARADAARAERAVDAHADDAPAGDGRADDPQADDALAGGRRSGTQAAAVLEWAASLAAQAAEGALSLARGVDATLREPPRLLAGVTAEWAAVPAAPVAPRQRPIVDTLRAVRAAIGDPSHPLARYALRLGLTVVVAHGIARALHVSRGLWIVTTVLLVLQPSAGQTRRRGLERLAGTLAGALVAALLGVLLRDRLSMAAAMFPLAVLAVTLRPVHYGLFTFFLTPVFVLLAEPAPGDWGLAAERIADTVIAGLLAFAASRVLWPLWEHRALAGVLADAVAASRAFAAAAIARAGGADEPDAIARARRAAGLASNAAEAAVERLLDEPRGRWRDDDALLALLAHVRRVNGAATALVAAPPPVVPDAALAATILDTLDRTAAGLAAERAPEATALVAAGTVGAAPERAALARLARHAAGVWAAAERALGGTPAPAA